MKKTLKKSLGMILVLTMIAGMVSGMTLTAFAGEGVVTMSNTGAGSSLNNPVVCSSYAEFKAAMEDSDIYYVSLGNADEVMPVIEGEGLIPAISVNGSKTLKLTGNAIFTAPFSGKTYAALLHTDANDILTIVGDGMLTFKAVANAAQNAVVYNQGGDVTISNGTLVGSYNTAVYGMAIWQSSGNLSIYSGRFLSKNAIYEKVGDPATYPVYILGGTTNIYGGYFCGEDVVNGNAEPYGICIENGASVSISGGEFLGVKLGSGARMGDYLAKDCVMSYNGEKVSNPDNYASIPDSVYVEIYKEISKVDININSPTDGISINNKVYSVPDGSYVHTVDWYEDGVWVDSPTTFKAGKSYKVSIQLLTDDSVKFTDPLTIARINGEDAVVSTIGNYSETTVILTLDLGVCPDTIKSVSLKTNTPKEHESYGFVTPVDDSYSVDYAYWFESDTGDDGTWTSMTQTDKFKVGKYYKVEVDIEAEDGYQFLLDSSLDPIVSATMNGYYADVVRTYDQDPSKCITVCYEFGMCNDSVIEDIRIVNVAKPVAGEHPQYVCNLLGSGYEFYEMQDYWYRINSIEWTDVTNGGTLLGEDSTFTPGHTYQFLVYLHAQDGYTFHVTGGNDAPATTATVNGNTANIKETNNAAKYQTITYEFTCEQKEISTIMIYNLDVPQAGMMPDTAITTAYPEYYVISNTNGKDYIHWYGNFADDGSFLPGEKYQVELKVVPTQVNGVTTSKFVKPIKGLIDGEEVTDADTGFDQNDGVLVSTSAIYLIKTYTVPAEQQQDTVTILAVYDEAFDLDGKAVVEVKLASGNGSKKITVNGTELYYNSQRDVYVGIVDASAVSGDTLTGAVVTDVAPTKFVYGNVDGDYDFEDIDEAIDSSDLQALKRALKGQKTLTGADLIAADLDGDGISDSSDLQALKQFLKVSKIFPILK